MSKVEFIKRYNNDFAFRAEARRKGIRVIQNNVIFFDEKGQVKNVAGNYVK